MKHVVIIRHGQYGSRFLTEIGQAQICSVIEQIAPKVNLEECIFLSSDEFRAVESALVAVKKIDEICTLSGSSHIETVENACKYAKTVAKIKEYDDDCWRDYYKTVVIFGHLEDLQNFIPYFGEEYLQTKLDPILGDQNSYGTTVIIDLQEKTLEIIQPIIT